MTEDLVLEGYVECPECGFGYIGSDVEQRLRHANFHEEFTSGVVLSPHPKDRIIGHVAGVEVLESAMDMPSDYRRSIARVAYRANHDMTEFPTSYDGGVEDLEYDGRAYVMRRSGRGVGLLVIRRRFPTWWMSWNYYFSRSGPAPIEDGQPRWTVDRVWLLQALRGQRLGRRFVHVVADHLAVELGNLAWLQEFTKTGQLLVRSLTSTGFWTCR